MEPNVAPPNIALLGRSTIPLESAAPPFLETSALMRDFRNVQAKIFARMEHKLRAILSCINSHSP